MCFFSSPVVINWCSGIKSGRFFKHKVHKFWPGWAAAKCFSKLSWLGNRILHFFNGQTIDRILSISRKWFLQSAYTMPALWSTSNPGNNVSMPHIPKLANDCSPLSSVGKTTTTSMTCLHRGHEVSRFLTRMRIEQRLQIGWSHDPVAAYLTFSSAQIIQLIAVWEASFDFLLSFLACSFSGAAFRPGALFFVAMAVNTHYSVFPKLLEFSCAAYVSMKHRFKAPWKLSITRTSEGIKACGMRKLIPRKRSDLRFRQLFTVAPEDYTGVWWFYRDVGCLMLVNVCCWELEVEDAISIANSLNNSYFIKMSIRRRGKLWGSCFPFPLEQ